MLQIELAKSLDALLVLGGEGADHSRSNHTYTLYYNANRNSPFYLILSGSHSGLSSEKPKVPEAEKMRKYLLDLGVPEDIIQTETKSLDTLGNIIFSRPIIDQLLSGYTKKRIGLVTDAFHMQRSLWAADRVLPIYYHVQPLPTPKETSLFGKAIEIAVKNAWRFDLWRENIEAGDQERFENYMAEKHPMHAVNAPFGAYKVGIHFLQSLRR